MITIEEIIFVIGITISPLILTPLIFWCYIGKECIPELKKIYKEGILYRTCGMFGLIAITALILSHLT